MSKIYEALQQAKKERKNFVSPSETLLPEVPPASPYPDIHALTMEKEMLSLYQNIEALLPNSPKKAIQFIGSREGEGTSTIVREFGRVTAGKLGKSVLILDADQLNPKQHPFFGIAPEYGWEDMLEDEAVVDKVLYQVKGSSLYLSPVSPNVAVTNHIFDSPKMEDLLNKLKERFDLILVDSSPASASPDGAAISRNVDGVVLVLEAEMTRWPVAENAKKTIEKNGGNILGVVFNKRRYHIPDFVYNKL